MCGGLRWDRHSLYSQTLQELLAAAQRFDAPARTGSAGSLRQRGNRVEPRLAAQYRQQSRRGQRQQADAELNHPGQEG